MLNGQLTMASAVARAIWGADGAIDAGEAWLTQAHTGRATYTMARTIGGAE